MIYYVKMRLKSTLLLNGMLLFVLKVEATNGGGGGFWNSRHTTALPPPVAPHTLVIGDSQVIAYHFSSRLKCGIKNESIDSKRIPFCIVNGHQWKCDYYFIFTTSNHCVLGYTICLHCSVHLCHMLTN